MHANFYGWIAVGCLAWFFTWGMNRAYLTFKKLLS